MYKKPFDLPRIPDSTNLIIYVSLSKADYYFLKQKAMCLFLKNSDTFDLDREYTIDGKSHCRNFQRINVTELNLFFTCNFIKKEGSHPKKPCVRCFSWSIIKFCIRGPKGT